MPEIVFSLCYTSRRVHEMEKVAKLWLERATRPDAIEIVLSVDSDYEEGLKTAHELLDKKLVHKIVVAPIPGNCVKGWNAAAEHSSGRVLIAIADDFIPPQQWDGRLVNLTPNGSWIFEDRVVHVQDGYNSNLCTLGIITRVRYEKFGFFFYPSYESMFSDTELTYRALQDGVLLEAPHLIFEHIHPDAGKRAKDSVDLNHSSSSRWARGEMLFNLRQKRGFPTDMGPKAKDFKHTGKYCVYTQAIKDDFCLLEVGKRMLEEGVSTFFFHIPDAYWDGRPTPQEDIASVQGVADSLRELGAEVNVALCNVAKYRQDGLRVNLETQVRNEAMNWITSSGFKHILIVDGDELWKRGLLNLVDKLVEKENPAVISTGMIPVVGLPGYPIDSARDKVTVYIRGDTRFSECRTPAGIQREIPGYLVYHFTATRKTNEEIVAKMRTSGHYDDPSYDFEGFIQNTLPNIKPGMRDVHFYKHFQIWPTIRVWTPSEFEDMPMSIRPYLASEVQPTGALHMPTWEQISPPPEPTRYFTADGYPKIYPNKKQGRFYASAR